MSREEFEFIDKQRAKADAKGDSVPEKIVNQNYYQPPWGEVIPLPEHDPDRQHAIVRYHKWYDRFPTLESYNKYCLEKGSIPKPPLDTPIQDEERPFIKNFFYHPPWGEDILLPNDETDRYKAITYYEKWYRIFPTKKRYDDYHLYGGTCPKPPDIDANFYIDMPIDSMPSTGGVTFGTGAKRDARALRYDLIPPCALKRLAQIYTEGAEHYGAHNWTKGMDYSDTINHALAHLFNYMSGKKDEDHLAKVAWAMFALMYFDESGVGYNDLYKWVEK